MKRSTIKNYFLLLKPFWAWFFVYVVLGVFYSVGFHLGQINFLKLALIFIIFQLFYGVIYIFNDLIDYESDRKNHEKSKRIIASGRVSRKHAFFFGLIALCVSLVASIFISLLFFWFEIFFLVYSLTYSLLFKKIPYIDVFSGGVTHFMRFIMGVYLFGGINSYYVGLAIYLMVIYTLFLKRYKEIKNGEEGRECLKSYSLNKIILLEIFIIVCALVLALTSRGLDKIITGIFFLLLLFFAIGYFRSKLVQRITNKQFSADY